MEFRRLLQQVLIVSLVSGICFGATTGSKGCIRRVLKHVWHDFKDEYGIDLYEFKPIHNLEQLGIHPTRLHGPIIRMRVAEVNADDTAGEAYFETSRRIVNDRIVSVFHSSRDKRGCWIPGVSCVTDCLKTFAIKHTARCFRSTQLCVVRPMGYALVPDAPAGAPLMRSVQVMLFDHERHIDSGESRGLVVDIDASNGQPYLRRAVGDEEPTVFGLSYRDDSANGVQASQWHLAGYAKDGRTAYHVDLRLERRFKKGLGLEGVVATSHV